MIKFYCDNCNGKIGVPDDAAGRRVRCPRCKEAVQIPTPQPEPAPVEVELTSMDASEADHQDSYAHDDYAHAPAWDDELLAGAADGPALDVERTRNCTECGAEMAPDAVLCVNCGHGMPQEKNAPATIAAPRAEKEKKQFSLGSGSTLFALIGGAAAALIFACLWAGLVCLIDREFGIIAWGMGACVGAVMGALAPRRSVGIAILAIFITLAGWITAKVLIVKWYAMPEINGMYFAEDGGPSEQAIEEFTGDPDSLFDLTCSYLVAQGEIDEDLELYLNYLPFGGITPPENRKQEVADAHAYVIDTMENLTEEDKADILRAQWDEYSLFLKLGAPIAAFFLCFGFFDILWVILAACSAFKVCRTGGS